MILLALNYINSYQKKLASGEVLIILKTFHLLSFIKKFYKEKCGASKNKCSQENLVRMVEDAL